MASTVIWSLDLHFMRAPSPLQAPAARPYKRASKAPKPRQTCLGSLLFHKLPPPAGCCPPNWASSLFSYTMNSSGANFDLKSTNLTQSAVLLNNLMQNYNTSWSKKVGTFLSHSLAFLGNEKEKNSPKEDGELEWR